MKRITKLLLTPDPKALEILKLTRHESLKNFCSFTVRAFWEEFEKTSDDYFPINNRVVQDFDNWLDKNVD